MACGGEKVALFEVGIFVGFELLHFVPVLKGNENFASTSHVPKLPRLIAEAKMNGATNEGTCIFGRLEFLWNLAQACYNPNTLVRKFSADTGRTRPTFPFEIAIDVGDVRKMQPTRWPVPRR